MSHCCKKLRVTQNSATKYRYTFIVLLLLHSVSVIFLTVSVSSCIFHPRDSLVIVYSDKAEEVVQYFRHVMA